MIVNQCTAFLRKGIEAGKQVFMLLKDAVIVGSNVDKIVYFQCTFGDK